MASATSSPLVSHRPTSNPSSGQTSPRRAVTSGGMGGEQSSISSAANDGHPQRETRIDSPTPKADESKEKDSAAPLLASQQHAASVSKSTTEPPSHEPNPNDITSTAAKKLERVVQRFLIRCPQAIIAMGATFAIFYWGMGNENSAYAGAAFVGVGGAVYCFVRPLFLEIIPDWMLNKTEYWHWRQVINITYTCFLTLTFSSAVWKLDISGTQGLIFLGLTFALPYRVFSRYYGDIDKQPTWSQERFGS